MIKVPFIRRFCNERISIKAATSRDQYVKPFEIDALVMLSDPYSTDNGLGPDAAKPKWTVMLSAMDLDGREIVDGATIEASDRHPRLFIHSVHPNGDSLWLDCTSTEAV